MIRSLLSLCAAVIVRGAPAKEESFDAAAMLEAISAVETGHNWRAVGLRGERGRCQIMPSTWAEYTRAEFARWAHRDTDVARTVERRHLSVICATLIRRGYRLDPALIAAAWRHGLARPQEYRKSDYAQRVAALYLAGPRVERGLAAAQLE